MYEPRPQTASVYACAVLAAGSQSTIYGQTAAPPVGFYTVMADLLGRNSLSSKNRLNKSGQLRQQNLPGDGLLELQESYSSCEETMRSESVRVRLSS